MRWRGVTIAVLGVALVGAVGVAVAPAAKTTVRPAEEEVEIFLHARKNEFAHVMVLRLYPLQGVATVSTLRSEIRLEDDRAVNYAFAIPPRPFAGSVDVEVPGLGEVVGRVMAGDRENGRPAPKGCTGPASSSETGSFQGRIDINGAGGLGRWRASEAEAWVNRSPERRCGPGGDRDAGHPDDLFSYLRDSGPMLPGPDDYWLAARRLSSHRDTVWDAMGRGGRVLLAAIDYEWLPGQIAVKRWVTQTGMPVGKSLVAGPGRPHPKSAVVHGTVPFLGTAHYSRNGRRLTGSLRARFPGLTLRLTGRGWKASFYDYDRER